MTQATLTLGYVWSLEKSMSLEKGMERKIIWKTEIYAIFEAKKKKEERKKLKLAEMLKQKMKKYFPQKSLRKMLEILKS